MRQEFIGSEGRVLLDTLRRLYRRKAWSALGKVLKKIHPAELAWMFRHLTPHERHIVFEMLKEPDWIGDFLSELDESLRMDLIATLQPERMAEVVTTMSPDDQADLVEALPEELREQVLALMKKEDAEEVEELLQYDPETAGGIMSPDFLAMDENLIVSEAIRQVQKLSEEAEMAFFIYVVEDGEKLTGIYKQLP